MSVYVLWDWGFTLVCVKGWSKNETPTVKLIARPHSYNLKIMDTYVKTKGQH